MWILEGVQVFCGTQLKTQPVWVNIVSVGDDPEFQAPSVPGAPETPHDWRVDCTLDNMYGCVTLRKNVKGKCIIICLGSYLI